MRALLFVLAYFAGIYAFLIEMETEGELRNNGEDRRSETGVSAA